LNEAKGGAGKNIITFYKKTIDKLVIMMYIIIKPKRENKKTKGNDKYEKV